MDEETEAQKKYVTLTWQVRWENKDSNSIFGLLCSKLLCFIISPKGESNWKTPEKKEKSKF